MTDSMKFGPEWLRNMATDMTNNQGSGGGGGGGGGSSSTSSSSSTNSNNNGSSNSYQFGSQQQQQQQVSQLQVRGQFPEFRYGREEMLSLFNKNCSMPEILPSFKKLFIDKVQYPLALTPSTEEEVFSSVTQPSARPQWSQRSPVLFNTASRGNGRGGSVDRGRMRGKSIYHPIFPRPTPMFEDEARNLKSERGWSERNGGGGESSSVGVPDWSISPSSSPRKDFSGHPVRNLENWRRSRHDEDGVVSSGPPVGGNANSGLSGGVSSGTSGGGGDGWRGSGTNNFGNNRWGRSTSWRDDDGGNGGGVESNAYNIPPMQRSYSTIATSERTYFSGLSKSSSLTSAAANSGGSSDGPNKSNGSSNNSRHHHQNSANHQWDTTEDMLPEWAMENPTDSGGTFDATGAFHGSVDEDEEKRRGEGSGSSSTTSSSSSSTRKKPNDSTTQDENNHRINRNMASKVDKAKRPVEQDRVSLDDEDSESNEIDQRIFKDEHLQRNASIENLIHPCEEISPINKLETSEEHSSDPPMNSSSPSQLTAQTTSTPNSTNITTIMMQASHKIPLTELSDRMQEVADDMVEKLIMDDDNVAQNSQKPSATATANSVAPSAVAVTGKLPSNVAILPPVVVGSNPAKVAALYKNQVLASKPMFLPVVDPILQQHHLQQQAAVAAAAAVMPPGTRMLPPPITKPSNELWYYRDPQSKVQGPFTAMEMIEWYRAGYFDENLYVRRMCDNRFAALGDLIKMCGQMPFQSSHLIPPLQSAEVPMSNPIPIMPMTPHDPSRQMKDASGVSIVKGPNLGSSISDLKGSVTATADALSAAVKNMMNPVDMSHMLNAHFQMLQEQYIRHQEMLVLTEFSTKDSFNRLTPSEKAACVRQKVHMMGLPEHLTSLAGLSNSLASLNPAAGNQLYDMIAECSKKDAYGMSPLEAQLQQFQQQHLHHQQQQQQVQQQQVQQQQVQQQQVQQQQVQQQQVQHQQVQQQVHQQSQNPYLEPEDFLQQQQQQQQANQQSGMYQGVAYRSAFPQMDGTGSNAPGEEQLNADLLNELNLRMMLRQGRLRSGREQAPLPPPLGAASNDFGVELLARAGSQVLAAAVVNMMPQWPPHMLPHGQIPQQSQQQQPPTQPNTQPQQVAPNQWPIIAGPVVVPQLQGAVGKPQAAMWATTDAGAQLIMQQQQPQAPQQQQQQVEVMHAKVENNFVSVQLQSQPQPQQQPQQTQHRHQDTDSNKVVKTKDELGVEDNTNAVNNNISVLAASNTITPPGVPVSQATYVSSSVNKVKNEKLKPNEESQNSLHNTTKQQPSASSATNASSNAINNANNNKRNGKQKSNEKPIDSSKNKPQQQLQTQSVAGPSEEERRKEAAEEKRKQKEEKKRQQQEEEKKKLQLAEEEKRRQASEEKERQKEIHAHRRKAMLSNNNGGSTANLSSNSNIAANGKLTTSGPGSTMSKQERMQTSVAPWSTNTHGATASTPGPSLAEIQKAERRERRADQQRLTELMEKQMRIAAAAEVTDNVLKWNAAPVAVKSLAEIQAEEAKRLASEQAANAELQRRKEQEQATSAAANNLSSSNPFAVIWSGSKVWGATNSISGFWEESVKFSTAAAAISSSAPTAASVVAKAVGQASATSSVTSKQSASIPSASGGNNSAASSVGGNRNLSKSQTVSSMQSSSNWTSVNTANNTSQTKSQQQSSFVKQQQQGSNSNENNNAQKGKKGNKNISGSSSSNNCSSSNSAATSVANNHINRNDDLRNEFTIWCMKSLNNMNPKVDVPTFVSFLQDLESPYEVKDYIRMYLGESKEYTEFAKQFLERRSKYKNLQRAQNAHIDDMCKPAPAINPSGNDSFDNKGKQKKVKKSKMTKLDARILGFSVTAAEGRINVGDRDYGDVS